MLAGWNQSRASLDLDENMYGRVTIQYFQSEVELVCVPYFWLFKANIVT